MSEAAAKPAEKDPLDVFIGEEDLRATDDDALAEEIGADEAAQINARKSSAARQKSAEAGAAMAVGFVGQLLAMVDPAAAFADEERDALTGSLAPVLLKNGGEPPAWMAEYQEEFNFFMVGVGVGVGVWLRVKAARAERENAKPANDEGASQ